MSPDTDFQTRLRKSLGNPSIQEGLADFQQRWRTNRDAHIGTLEERTQTSFADLAAQIDAAKTRARRDPRILAGFIEQAESNGAQVLHAADAAQACQLIADICRRHQAQLVVKTKSMATEEISLNEHLMADGCTGDTSGDGNPSATPLTVIETDLGEWLLQVDHDRPSHLIVPAVHKRRHEIARLLERIYGRAFDPDDIQSMARTIRSELRPHFMAAGVGITGANILVAETGAVALVTNEGNAGMTVALPPVQIVLAGADKLVETTADALKIIQLLAKSATGQVISSYTQFINGPVAQRAAGDRGGDGGNSTSETTSNTTSAQYIVLLDNGRSDMAADPQFESALSCIRCGACANVCPPYQVVGGHAFGHVYSGAIGLVNTAFHHGMEAAAGPQSLCISCGACAKVCPADIPLPQQILAVRAKSFAHEPKHTKLALRLGVKLLRSRRLTAAAAAVGKILTLPLERHGTLKRLPLPRRHRYRTPPALPARPARRHAELKAVSDRSRRGAAKRAGQTALFLQCISDRLAPTVPLAALKLLEDCGAQVVVPTGQHCCGLAGIDLGDLPAARKMAAATLDVLEEYAEVITPAISCVLAIKHDYPDLFADDPAQLKRAEELARRTTDLVSYLNERMPAAGAETADGAATNGLADEDQDQVEPTASVAAHTFCQNNRSPALPELLQKSTQCQPAQVPEGDVCCGFGGMTSLANPEVSQAVTARKLKNLSKSGASVVVTDNPGCMMHLQAAARAADAPFKVQHIAEFLAERRPRQTSR